MPNTKAVHYVVWAVLALSVAGVHGHMLLAQPLRLVTLGPLLGLDVALLALVWLWHAGPGLARAAHEPEAAPEPLETQPDAAYSAQMAEHVHRTAADILERLQQETERVRALFDEQSHALQELQSESDTIVQSITLIGDCTVDTGRHLGKVAEEISHNAASIKSQSGSMQQIDHSIHMLNEKVVEINAFSNVIESIAAQTNILALNASIEAARSGSAGRGFSVVANEVYVLAGKSRDSAKQISQKIGELQKQSEDARGCVHKAGRELQEVSAHVEELNNLVAEAGAAFDVIKNMITTIDESMHRQKSSLESIAGSIARQSKQAGSTEQGIQSLMEELMKKIHSLVC